MRKHGTVRRYLQGPDADNVEGEGCRCDPCSERHAAYMRQWRATGTTKIPVPELIRRQLEDLVKSDDWTYRQIGKELGMDHKTMADIVAGVSKSIYPRTLEKLGMLPDLVDADSQGSNE